MGNYVEFGPFTIDCEVGKPKNHENCKEVPREGSWNENVNLLIVD